MISKFGQRSATGVNDGIDISMPVGTPVKASQSGTVIYAGSELEDFGNLILVSHAGGWVSAYAHSSANLVRRGEKVKRGQVIAKSGRSGNAKVPKLHFELPDQPQIATRRGQSGCRAWLTIPVHHRARLPCRPPA